MLNLSDKEVRVTLGESSSIAGQVAVQSINAACRDLKNNEIDAIVTAPINKYSVQSDDFNFTGHTEFLLMNLVLPEV